MLTKGWLKKPYHFCCGFFSFLWVGNDNFVHFWILLFMQITTMALTQFLDNFGAKIFHKYESGVKIKVNIFVKVLKSATSLNEWWLSFLGGDHPIWVVTTLLVVLTHLGRGLVYPKMDGQLPQRMVTNRKGWSTTWKTNLKK